MDRNYLSGQIGDAINEVLAAVGYNFSLLFAWFTLSLSALWLAFTKEDRLKPIHKMV